VSRTTWWTVGWAVLAAITLLVVSGTTLSLDQATLGWFTVLDQPHAVHLAWRTLVMGGQFWLVGSAVVVTAAVRARAAHAWRPLLCGVGAVAVLDAVLLASKSVIGRTSPHSGLNEVLTSGSSYPSGHTANATMCLTLLAVLVTSPGSDRRHRAVRTAVLLAIGVGLANLVLGYHWLSEVVAGWLLGALIVIAAAQYLSAATEPVTGPPELPIDR